MQIFSLLWGVWETAPRHHLSSQSLSILISPLLLVQHTRSSFPAITHHYSTRVEAWDSSPSFFLSLSLQFASHSLSVLLQSHSHVLFLWHITTTELLFHLQSFNCFFIFFWYRQWCKRYKCFSLLLAEVSVSCLWRKVWLNRLLSTELNPVITVGLFALLKIHNASLRHFIVENKLFLRQSQHYSYVYVMVLKKRIPWMHFDWTASTKCISVMDC